MSFTSFVAEIYSNSVLFPKSYPITSMNHISIMFISTSNQLTNQPTNSAKVFMGVHFVSSFMETEEITLV